MKYFKNKYIVSIGAVLSVVALGQVMAIPTEEEINAEIIHKSETLDFDIRSDSELQEMITSHEAKLPEVKKTADKFTECPECIRYELRQFLEEQWGESGEMTPEEITAEVESKFNRKKANAEQELQTLEEAVDIMKKEKQFRTEGKVIRDISVEEL